MTLKAFEVQGQIKAENIVNGGITASTGTSAVVQVVSTNTQYSWTFGTDGSLAMPGDTTQSQQDNTLCSAGVETVIYTATARYQHAVKLFVMVEGADSGPFETQACDIIAVRGFVNNIVHVTAYGVTYSGLTPLATFDGRWNGTTNRLEITCLPASTTTSVAVSVHAIEMTSNDL